MGSLGILKRPPQLAELKEGQSVTVLLFPKQLGGEAPAENQYRQYMRVGGKLLSWAAKDMGSVDFAEVFPSTVTINDIPAGEADYDKFLVSHAGMLKYRTAAQMQVDLGLTSSEEAAHSIPNHADVAIAGPVDLDVLQYNGTNWVDRTLAEAGISATGHLHDDRYYTETEIDAMPLVDYSGTPVAAQVAYFADVDTIQGAADFAFDGDTLLLTNMPAGVDNSVVILDADGKIKTDEIDSRVWGATLVAASGTPTAGHIPYFTGAYTIAHDASQLFWDAANNRLGIGRDAPVVPFHVQSVGVASTISPAVDTHIVVGLSTEATNPLWFEYADTPGVIWLRPGLSNSGVLAFATRTGGVNYERMRITNAGLVGIGEAAPDKLLTLADEGDAGSKTFESGFGGTGWKFDHITAHQYNLELDHLFIRKSMTVWEFIVNQVYAFAGSETLGPGRGKIASVSGNDWTMEDPMDTGVGASPFAVGDVLLIQVCDLNFDPGTPSYVKHIVRKVAVVSGNVVTVTTATGGPGDTGTPAQGDSVVVIGNETDATRRALIYRSVVDSNSPFTSVYTDMQYYADWLDPDNIRVHYGNLNGKYGYEAEIYGFAAGEYAASAGKQYISVDPTNGLRIMQYQDSWKTMLVASADLFQVGETADKLKYVPSTNILTLGNWTVTTSALENLTSNAGVKLDATNQKLQIGDLDETHMDLIGGDGSLIWYLSTGVNTNREFLRIDDSIPGTLVSGVRIVDGGFYINRNLTDVYAIMALYQTIDDGGGLALRSSDGAEQFEAYWHGSVFTFNITDLGPNASSGTPLHWYAGGAILRYTSSLRYKENVTALETNPAIIHGLEVKSYTSIDSKERTFGLIAEEVALVEPRLVVYDKKGRPDAIRFPLINCLMLEELKKLRVNEDGLNIRVDELESQKLHARLVDLEAQVATLKTQLAIA